MKNVPQVAISAVAFLAVFFSFVGASARSPHSSAPSNFVLQSGTVSFPSAHASLRVPDGFGFLSQELTEIMVDTLWHQSAPEHLLGSFVSPASARDFTDVDRVAYVFYHPDGYVSLAPFDNLEPDVLLDAVCGDLGIEGDAEWALRPSHDKDAHTVALGVTVRGEDPWSVVVLWQFGRRGVLRAECYVDPSEVNTVYANVANIFSFDKYYDYDSFLTEGETPSNYDLMHFLAPTYEPEAPEQQEQQKEEDGPFDDILMCIFGLLLFGVATASVLGARMLAIKSVNFLFKHL